MPRVPVMVRILMAGVAAAAAGAKAPPARAPASRFSAATYNIHYGNRNLPLVAATIRKSGADLVCLQETNAASERYLRRALRGVYPYAAFRNHHGAGGFAFLSKAPLRELKYIPGRHGPFGMWTARLRLGGRDVRTAAAHLCPVVPRRGETLMGTFLRTEAVRAREIAWFHQRLPGDLPVILLGDFNSTSTLSAPSFLAGRGFVDSFASVTPDPDRHITWHWRYQEVNWRFRIDYIFHPAALKTLRSRVVRSEASDHYLLVSTLEWAPKKPTTTSAAADG